jgi:hypothetical protein
MRDDAASPDGAARPMPSSIVVDFDPFPIVLTQLPARIEADAARAMYDLLEEGLRARPGPFLSIVDTTRVEALPDAVTRRILAEQGSPWLRDRIRDHGLGSVLVVSNPLVRAGLTAINWIRTSLSEDGVAADLREAAAWARPRLEAADALGAAARAFVERHA